MYDSRDPFDPFPDPVLPHLDPPPKLFIPAQNPLPLLDLADPLVPHHLFGPADFERGPEDLELSLEAELAHLLGSSPEAEVLQPSAPLPRPAPHDRRKPRRRPARHQKRSWVQAISIILAAITTVVVAMVSAFGAVISYNPLLHLAAPIVPHGLAQCWPLLVFGPWLVASLSVLRAALHYRRAAHSWTIVILFSALAVTLCINHADKTLAGIAVASLPPCAALTCFHQLVRQITLTRPHRRPPRHRPHRAR